MQGLPTKPGQKAISGSNVLVFTTKPGKNGHFGVDDAGFSRLNKGKWPFRGRLCRFSQQKTLETGHFGVENVGFSPYHQGNW